jgi:hypothetical protein
MNRLRTYFREMNTSSPIWSTHPLSPVIDGGVQAMVGETVPLRRRNNLKPTSRTRETDSGGGSRSNTHIVHTVALAVDGGVEAVVVQMIPLGAGNEAQPAETNSTHSWPMINSVCIRVEGRRKQTSPRGEKRPFQPN